ncbi:MAG: hypothetical protein WAQ08_04105 [Aquabacterium sp.]|jgi:hypothetical protein|uniref:hypothetical protein n=1 Tax=Aquabacterium sp. TaxID=1872578 RepID=UPI003BB19ED0
MASPFNNVSRGKHWPAWLVALCCSAPVWALAQDAGDKQALAQARTEAGQQYQAALAQCGRLPVRDKDVCQWTAKAERTKREQRAEARYQGTPQAAHVARLSIAQADLEVNLRVCGQRSGTVTRTCKLEAREQFNRAKADAEQAMRDGRVELP